MQTTNEGCTQSPIPNLVDLVNEIAVIGEYRKAFKKECASLTRRVKLLGPLFEEVKEFRDVLPEQAVVCFNLLLKALQEAKELLRFCHDGSKICMVLEREAIASRFLAVTAELEQALDGLAYDSLGISDEVQEQVELVHAQLKRAKGRDNSQNVELFGDLEAFLSHGNDQELDPVALERLAEKLQLKTMSEINQESRALNHMILDKYGGKYESFEHMSCLLRWLKDLSLKDLNNCEKSPHTGAHLEKPTCPAIPDDFCCPISLELMRDPVIVATGQTYERVCIQKWLDSGNKTCPKTKQVLPHLILTPNYVLRSLIAQWCERQGIELPKIASSSKIFKSAGMCTEVSSGYRQTVEVLLQKLFNGQPDVQRSAAAELRFLAKRNAENRVCIAEAGAIPVLVGLLSSRDQRTQEHAVTALLNLSIHDSNKGAIVLAGAIDPIVEVLKNGSMEARENAAATLFSLSVLDENKITIGASGAITALVSLLCEGTFRGKKDAATALFNLSIYQGNKVRAVRAGVVPPLLQLLTDPMAAMVDEALAILAVLATHQEGKVAIGHACAIPILVDLIRIGSPKNRENGAAVLLALCSNDSAHTAEARQLGAYGPLYELAQTGTARARRKAATLLEHMNKHEH